MKYLVQWSVPQATFKEATQRFVKTGAPPPDGVKQLGRWHTMNGTGCAIMEAKDQKAIYQLVAEWGDMIDIQAAPVLEDAEAGEVLGKLYG
jgi:hypothetical protein